MMHGSSQVTFPEQFVGNERRRKAICTAASVLVFFSFVLSPPELIRAQSAADDSGSLPNTNWVGTWGASPTGPATNSFFAPSAYNGNNTFNDQTIRLVAHASLGGSRVRIRLSNELGTTPLAVSAAHLALSDGAGPAILAGSDRVLTFNSGDTAVTIPPGAPVVSDPVDLDVPALANLSVSLFFAGSVTVTTGSPNSLQTNYVAPANGGDLTGVPSLPLDAANPTITQWPLLTAVEVRDPGAHSLVVEGSSISLGFLTTVNANVRWVDVLAKRLRNHALPVGVVNASIVANHLLANTLGPGALARLESDVLARSGIGYLFINDVLGVECQSQSDPAVIIGGLRQLLTRAHTRGVKVYAGTVLPLGGATGYSATFEDNRQAVNAYIRTGVEVDGYVDFDAALSDPANPTQLLPAYDGGDHHHPNDAGNKRMAQVFDLGLFR